MVDCGGGGLPLPLLGAGAGGGGNSKGAGAMRRGRRGTAREVATATRSVYLSMRDVSGA